LKNAYQLQRYASSVSGGISCDKSSNHPGMGAWPARHRHTVRAPARLLRLQTA